MFDIQIAENILTNDKSKSYQSLVYKYFKVKLAKSETHSNWLLRPLSKRQLKYASEDVTYLIEIFEKQSRILKKKNIYKNAIKDSKREANLGNQDLIISRLNKLKESSETERKIQDALNYLTKGKTTLVIAHRLSTILNSYKIYVIDNGEVVAKGNHKELLENSKVYKNFYEKQIQKN